MPPRFTARSQKPAYGSVTLLCHDQQQSRPLHNGWHGHSRMNLTALPGVILDGKYRIEQQLGQGGMGAVFVATHLGTTRTVAVKVIVPQLAAQDEFLLRFQREAEAAGRLRHPNVVNVTDFGFTTIEGAQLAYLVMEFLDGQTLAGFLKNNPRPAPSLILDLIDQVALGLDAAHEAGIVHRDLKPDNIWLESNRRGGHNIKVLDFGIAKLNNPAASAAPLTVHGLSPGQTPFPERAAFSTSADSETMVMPGSSEAATIATTPDLSSQSGGSRYTRSYSTTLQTSVGSVLGTPAFMAPEQCQGAAVDHRADVYSLATIAYQLFCGRLPFEAKTMRDLLEQQIKAVPPAPRKLDGSIADGVSRAILRGLEKDPGLRQNSAGMLAAQIRAGAAGETTFLASGKIFANNYLNCFGPLLLACLAPVVVIDFVLITILSAIFRAKIAPTAALLGIFHLISFTLQAFMFQVYKAGCTLMFEDAAAIGYFRPPRVILGRLLKGLLPMLGMFFSSALSLRGRSFLEGALWPTVWASEGLTGRAALDRAGALANTQRAATLALVARQLGVLLFSSLSSPTLVVSVTGGFQEYGSLLFEIKSFSWFLMLYPIPLSAIFLSFGPAFDFLYLSTRRCLGETVERTLPTSLRAKRSGSAPVIRPATVIWLLPGLVMVANLMYHARPKNAADIDIVDAATDGRRAAVLKAISAGTPVDAKDNRARTPLYYASSQGDLDLMRRLLERGANVNAQSSTGSTPLMMAVSNHRLDAVKLLLENHADVRAANSDGRTALIIAAMQGDLVVCRLLLSAGADTNRRDASGRTARDFAREEGYPEVVALLSK